MTNRRFPPPRPGFIQGAFLGTLLTLGSHSAIQYWKDSTPFRAPLWSAVVEERPAERAARLLGEVAFNMEAMFHRELTQDDTPALLDGALAALDPHGGYIAPDQVRTLTGTADPDVPYRVGVLGTPLPDRFVVETSAPGSPADRAGLRPGDQIIAIAGRDMSGLDGQVIFDHLLEAIEASGGAPIEVGVRRGQSQHTVAMTPEPLPPFYAFDLGIKGDVAHIAVTAFYPGAAEGVGMLVARALDEGARGVVLDLRGNSGGRVDEAIAMMELFAPANTLVYIRDARGQSIEEGMTHAPPRFANLRLGVLIDGESASASEILAAAVQAKGLGVVVGEPSYGKGSIQTVYPLEAEAGAIKMTIGFYRDPLGRTIEGVGVEPHLRAPWGGPGPRPLYGQIDAGFDAAAQWIRGDDPVPDLPNPRPSLALAHGGGL